MDQSRIVKKNQSQSQQIGNHGKLQKYYTFHKERLFFYYSGIFYITNNSKTFTFWNIPHFSHYELLQNFYIIDNLRIFTFWAIPEFSHSRSLKNFHSLPTFKFSPSGSFKNFLIPDLSRTFTLWTVPDLILF